MVIKILSKRKKGPDWPQKYSVIENNSMLYATDLLVIFKNMLMIRHFGNWFQINCNGGFSCNTI